MTGRRLQGLVFLIGLVLALATAADAVKIVQPATGGPPSGAAGGDLGGNYPNPTVTSGAHIGAGTIPNAALVTTPITACSGDINPACSQVTSGAHIGAGTLPTNALTGWPGSWFSPMGAPVSANNTAISANKVFDAVIDNPTPKTCGKLYIYVQTSDAVGTYDWGYYSSSSGPLVHCPAAVTVPSTGIVSCTPASPVTIPAGPLMVAITGTATTAHFAYDSYQAVYSTASTTDASAGGVLPASVTFPANSTPSTNNGPWVACAAS